ncbi:MAG: SDR family oxidoreductase [Verrucomicrobia bacterium]|nr:SDR family oxidoreductase [Verrucomicrobiota bacterium]
MSAKAQPQRVVLITGAAGGLGQGLVAEFLAHGWRVAAGWHSTPPSFVGENVLPLHLDVTNRTHCESAVKEILSRWNHLDALINNAGITADQLLAQHDETDWQRVLDVNLRGAFLCSQAALRPMLKQRDGHIISLSSFSGRSGARGQTAYAAAKAGLLGLTQSLAKEVGSRNVRVNAVLPGVLPTPMTAGLKATVLDEFAAANALGRINDATEVARFIAFLATTQNISGQLFQLDSRIAPWT